MKHIDHLRKRLDQLQRLTRFQRILRMSLRAFWLGLGGVMLGWGLNALLGWLPDPLTWLLIGATLAAVPLAALLKSLSPRSAWVWRLDRTLGLEEQVSTAWDVAEKEQPGEMDTWLVQDVNSMLPKVHARVQKYGWFLEMDLVSTLVIILLGVVLLASSLLQPYSDLLGDNPQAIAAPAMPPPFELAEMLQQDLPPSAAPENSLGAGDQDSEAQSDQPGDGQSGEQPDTGGQEPSDEQPPGSQALEDILSELGSDLSRQAGTYDLGQELENLDINGAADALEELNGQLDELSSESRGNMAQALEDAANALDEVGPQNPDQQALEDDMRSAAESLQEENLRSSEPLGDVAGDLRQLAEELGSSETAGGGEGEGQGGGTGAPEPLSRLQGESGDMELPLTDPSGSSLLTPGSSNSYGDGVAGGSPFGSSQAGDDVIQSPLLPGSFFWKWRNVVSQYFQR